MQSVKPKDPNVPHFSIQLMGDSPNECKIKKEIKLVKESEHCGGPDNNTEDRRLANSKG